MIDALSGNETHIGLFQIVIHDDSDREEVAVELKEKLEEIYDGEPGHKIARISYQRGHKFTAANAGHEDIFYNDIRGYIEKTRSTEYYPLIFSVHCFVSFSPLKLQ